MGRSATEDLDKVSCSAISARVRDELSVRRLTRSGLAHDARISLSTLEKALSGRRPFTRSTVLRLEAALGIVLRPDVAEGANGAAATGAVADDEVGSYARAAVTFLEGDYLTLRPSFGSADAVYAYRTTIAWETTAKRLQFRESERKDADFTPAGVVTVPHQTGQIYLVTNRHGQYRLVVISRPTIQGEMHGLLTTLQVVQGSHLMPVSMPISYIPLRDIADPAFGTIHGSHCHYARYRRWLDRQLGDRFAMMINGWG
jgi:transcriptional regulator with XRE-family HTH domain